MPVGGAAPIVHAADVAHEDGHAVGLGDDDVLDVVDRLDQADAADRPCDCWLLSSSAPPAFWLLASTACAIVAMERLYLSSATRIDLDLVLLDSPPKGVTSATPGTCSKRGSMTQSWSSRSSRVESWPVAFERVAVELADRRGERAERRRRRRRAARRRAAFRARPAARSSRRCRRRRSARRPRGRRWCASGARSRWARCSARARWEP